MKVNRYFIAGYIFLICSQVVFGGGELWEIQTSPSARIKALGEAGAGLRENAGVSVNPGTLSYDPCSRMSLFYGSIYEGSHYGYLEYVYPFAWWGSLGAAAEFRFKDNSNHLQNYYLAFSFMMARGLNLGLAAKAASKTLDGSYGDGFGIDLGIHASPLEWLNIGINGRNLNQPEISYKENGTEEVLERAIIAGVSVFLHRYFTLVWDVAADNLDVFTPEDLKQYFGIEIYPDPSFALRGGVKENNWRMGLGIVSEKINFDYAYVADYAEPVHYFQYTYKFTVSPSRKEKELMEKEEVIRKDEVYLNALRHFNLGEIALARKSADEYIDRFGRDQRITKVEEDIGEWLNKMREEKIGRADELSKEILRDYYQGRIKQALIKIENAKLIAPNYDKVRHLEHLLNARVLLEDGRYREAEQELVQALKINPDSQEVKQLHKRIQEVLKLSGE